MRPLMLPDIFALHGRWRARQPAVIAPDEVMDWATLDRRANQVANGLLEAGCGAGARVGVVMSNGAAMVEVLLGAMKAGAVVAPLNTSVTDDAIAAMLRDAEVTAIFVTSDHAERIADDVRAQARLSVSAGEAGKGWRGYAAWRDAQPDHKPPVAIEPDHICNIIYSSGTTGQPKGIVHTHGARLDWTHDLAHALRYHSGARLLIATGLYSNISWAGMLPTLMLGGTLVVRAGFDVRDVLETIERERVTHTSMVPAQFQRLIEHPDFDAYQRGSMQAMMCCGAPLPLRVKQRLFETFACGVIELYGSTEGVVTTLAPEEAKAGKMTSVGKPLPGEDIAILDDRNEIAPPGAAGEIVALSRFAMSGYWRNAAASEDAFWTDRDGRRWLRSGDIGRIDAEGYLYITDRKKDMIISGGQNIYPADIEAVLVRHPEIADCAVFGVPSARWGETPLALVVLRDGAKPSADSLREWANQQLGKQQRLHAVELRKTLPRNANGKLLKRDLRAPYWSKA